MLKFDGKRQELSGGYCLTTNNRMEMMAAIVGLRSLKTPSRVTLYSDSRYLVDAITKGWAQRWQAHGWMRNKKEAALNPDLWTELLELCKRHKVTFKWVKGHAGQSDNERCDQLSTQSARRKGLPEDPGYGQKRPLSLFD